MNEGHYTAFNQCMFMDFTEGLIAEISSPCRGMYWICSAKKETNVKKALLSRFISF